MEKSSAKIFWIWTISRILEVDMIGAIGIDFYSRRSNACSFIGTGAKWKKSREIFWAHLCKRIKKHFSIDKSSTCEHEDLEISELMTILIEDFLCFHLDLPYDESLGKNQLKFCILTYRCPYFFDSLGIWLGKIHEVRKRVYSFTHSIYSIWDLHSSVVSSMFIDNGSTM